MIELKNKKLVFTFPEIHPRAKLTISFKKTLRIPDDGNTYPLPPGLGNFPLVHVDDHEKTVPDEWLKHGGVMLPMHQSEAMWINFDSDFIEEHDTEYPFAVKIATGKINAVTGGEWSEGLERQPQNYLVAPKQPWLDGYHVTRDSIRQFVAMPLGDGYTAEGQITGREEFGGLQIQVYPMKREAFEKRWPKVDMAGISYSVDEAEIMYCRKSPDMGLAPGGLMRQEIYADEFDFSEWERGVSSRCFVHLANSRQWKTITGKLPPENPPTARDYSERGLPWFDYYSDDKPLPGSRVLNGLKSVFETGKSKRQNPLPENESADPKRLLILQKRQNPDQVREWRE